MMKRGFTLIEILVAVSIILLLTVLTLPDFRQGQKGFALQSSAHQLSQDIRKVQEMAMSARGFAGAPATFKGAYGIKIETGSPNYILFADLNNDKIFDFGEAIETISLEKGIKISALSPPSPSVIIFLPPDPATNIVDLAVVTLATDDGQTKTVEVNKVGLITVN